VRRTRVPASPPVTLVRQFDTHRLIASRHLPRGDSVLTQIADDDEHLQAIFALEGATNERLLAARQLLPGIGLEELVFGVPFASVINAAFCHAHPLGGRFNGPDRGAWYAAFEVETAQAEVAFHKAVQLAEIDRWEDSVTYDDYFADFTASFHDLRARVRGRARFREHLDPDSYVKSQELAEQLLGAGSLGVVYPSVRREGGTCVACFRPALVSNVRRGPTYRFTWEGTPVPSISRIR
jgi:RES domain-containing protein